MTMTIKKKELPLSGLGIIMNVVINLSLYVSTNRLMYG